MILCLLIFKVILEINYLIIKHYFIFFVFFKRIVHFQHVELSVLYAIHAHGFETRCSLVVGSFRNDNDQLPRFRIIETLTMQLFRPKIRIPSSFSGKRRAGRVNIRATVRNFIASKVIYYSLPSSEVLGAWRFTHPVYIQNTSANGDRQ